MNNETKNIEIDKDTKILLLSVLKKGYFSKDEAETIMHKIVAIDPFAQIRRNNGFEN